MELSQRTRVRAGDHDEFGVLFEEHARAVYNHAFRLTGNWSAAEEVVSLTSAVRFGLALELPGLPDVGALNEILIFAQPAHLQKMLGRTMDQAERNVERATFVRGRLAATAAGNQSA